MMETISKNGFVLETSPYPYLSKYFYSFPEQTANSLLGIMDKNIQLTLCMALEIEKCVTHQFFFHIFFNAKLVIIFGSLSYGLSLYPSGGFEQLRIGFLNQLFIIYG